MGTGYHGTFVVSWSQTELDGLQAAPVGALTAGAVWSWRGEAVCVDGPAGLLRLDEAEGSDALRRGAARKVRRLVGAALDERTEIGSIETGEPLMDQSFVVTNGARSYTVTVIETGRPGAPLLMFHDQIPPRESDLWVVHHTLNRPEMQPGEADAPGFICFTPGTRIATPEGPKLVEELRIGDMVRTRDGGPQPIEWIGRRHMTGARLFAMPQLRPVRIRAGALGIERPDQELLVSPEHRMLLRGPAAQALFNTPEVLVAARDLVNGSTVVVDTAVRQATYIHLLLPSHNILWANGVETESFHPASSMLTALGKADRDRLLAGRPEIARDPYLYGGFARRNLSESEAALLLYEAA